MIYFSETTHTPRPEEKLELVSYNFSVQYAEFGTLKYTRVIEKSLKYIFSSSSESVSINVTLQKWFCYSVAFSLIFRGLLSLSCSLLLLCTGQPPDGTLEFLRAISNGFRPSVHLQAVMSCCYTFISQTTVPCFCTIFSIYIKSTKIS